MKSFLLIFKLILEKICILDVNYSTIYVISYWNINGALIKHIRDNKMLMFQRLMILKNGRMHIKTILKIIIWLFYLSFN